MVERLPAMWETGFDPWVRKIPWRRKQQPTPVLLPGKFHGWRSLMGYSAWGRKELDTTEQLHFTSLQGFLFIGLSSHMHFPRRYSRKKLPYPKFSNCICRKRKNKR